MSDNQLRSRFLELVPVYPEQISIHDLSHALNVSNSQLRAIIRQMPSEMPLAENGAFLCFPDSKRKRASIEALSKPGRFRRGPNQRGR